MGEPLTDGVLVQRAGRGDSIAFSELVHRHFRRAMRVAYGLMRTPQDAEDVAQEAFARVHARLSELKGASAFYLWLYRIVVNLSIDRARRRRREGATAGTDSGPEQAAPLPPPSDAATAEAASSPPVPGESAAAENPTPRRADSAARRSRPGESAASAPSQAVAIQLREAFAQLPEIYQAVLLLRDLEGFSYDEIAVTLQINRGAVMSRLFHARKAVQLHLHGALPGKLAGPEGGA